MPTSATSDLVVGERRTTGAKRITRSWQLVQACSQSLVGSLFYDGVTIGFDARLGSQQNINLQLAIDDVVLDYDANDDGGHVVLGAAHYDAMQALLTVLSNRYGRSSNPVHVALLDLVGHYALALVPMH